MSNLDPRDAEHFGKLIGLLGSTHDGERAVAALKATKFLAARELAWFDIAQMLKHPPAIYRPKPVPPSRSHQMDARRCLQSGTIWKPYERDFLLQMAAQLRRPSDKQRDWLDGLVDRSRRGARP